MTVSRCATLERVAMIPSAIPSTPTTAALAPIRRSPRVYAQIPAIAASRPTRIGQMIVRAESGGSASQNATAPRTRPTIPPTRRAPGSLPPLPPARTAAVLMRSAGRPGPPRGPRRCSCARRLGRLTRCGGARPDLPAEVPHVEDHNVGADEEQDEALDDQRQVASELRREDVGAETRAARGRPVEE